MEHNNLYRGISKCAWAYFFLYFDINLGSVSILPDFVAWWMFLEAIDLLREEERDLLLLHPLAIMLGLWHCGQWVLSWFGKTPDGWIPGADIVVCLANLYFHFQLLTNLASIAAKHQPAGAEHDRKLLKYRTMQTVLFTVMMVLTQISFFAGNLLVYVSMVLAGIYIIAGLCMMAALFSLRKEFTPGQT